MGTICGLRRQAETKRVLGWLAGLVARGQPGFPRSPGCMGNGPVCGLLCAASLSLAEYGCKASD